MSHAIVSDLIIYPVKSLAGISLSTAQAHPRGFEHDRRWMVVNAHGARQSQREHPRMALAQVALVAGGLTITAPRLQPLWVPFAPQAQSSMTVTIGRTTLRASCASPACDAWFSDLIGEPAHLVCMDTATHRLVNPQYAVANDEVSFADGYPFMLVSEASLNFLNAHMSEPLPMNRFRPNIVVRGTPAFAEDTWKEIQIGGTRFVLVKPCDRCVLTTIDQALGERRGPEPLRTLTRYRQVDQDIYFGQYLLQTTPSTAVSTGDVLTVLAWNPEPVAPVVRTS